MSSDSEEISRWGKYLTEQHLRSEFRNARARYNTDRIREQAMMFDNGDSAWDFFFDDTASVRDFDGYDPMVIARKHLRRMERLFSYLRWYFDYFDGKVGFCKIIFQGLIETHHRISLKVFEIEDDYPKMFLHIEPKQGNKDVEEIEEVILKYRKNLIRSIVVVATAKRLAKMRRTVKRTNNRLFFALLAEINRFNKVAVYFERRTGLAISVPQIETEKLNWPTRSVWREIGKQKGKGNPSHARNF